jgi:D-tyrosyl-tRNA(Tyr) deacylase
MKVVVQRVSEASVEVESKIVGSIRHGLLVLVGFHSTDTKEKIEWMCDKICNLRIFTDNDGKMNISVKENEGEILVVSQFTLYGDARKGNRPSFIESAPPDLAIPLYNFMIDYLTNKSGLSIQSGLFGAMMKVSLINDGPVTLMIEK